VEIADDQLRAAMDGPSVRRAGASTPATGADPPARSGNLTRWAVELALSDRCRSLSDGRYQLRLSQSELARQLGLSPGSGSISRRLNALERLGLLASRRPVIIDLSSLEPFPGPGTSGEAAHPSGTSPEAPPPAGPDAPSGLAEGLLTLTRDLLGCGRDDLVPVALECLRLAMVARNAAPEGSESAPMWRGSSVPRASSLSSPLSSARTSSRASSPAAPPGGPDPAAVAAVPAAVGRRMPPEPVPPQEVMALLTPLLEECSRRGLPGVTGPTGLFAAFADCDAADIRRGVELVCRQLAVGVPLRSPVGVLAHLARRGDLRLLADLPGPGPTVAVHDPLDPFPPPAPESAQEWLARIAEFMRTGAPDGVEASPPDGPGDGTPPPPG